MVDTISFISWLPDGYSITAVQESFPYYAKNSQKSQCFTIYNEYKQRQTKYSFFYFSNEANNKINRPMLENSRALNSRVLNFIGVLSKFPKLKTSVFQIAGQWFIRVIRSLSNFCLNCNHCISIISRIFWTPANNTTSLHQAMRSIVYVSLFVAWWFAAIWKEVNFIDRDPHWYIRRVKEAIQTSS